MVPSSYSYPRRGHSVYYRLHSPIRVFNNFMNLSYGRCSIICIPSSFWNASCNFLPWNSDVSYFTKHLQGLDIVMQGACSDLLLFYSFFLIMQESNDIIKRPVWIIYSFMNENIAAFPSMFHYNLGL